MADSQETAGIVVPDSCWRWIKLQRPGSDYIKEIQQDFLMIEPYLPERAESILDIGCGMAGIDVLLKRKYPKARLELLDGDGEVPVYSFNEKSKPYNSREETEKFLKANGVSVDRWHDVGTREHLKADLVISLLSWGFHYPMSAYNVSGTCVLDKRRGKESQGGILIHAAQKYDRCLVRL